ncbi:glutamate--tRNA ligase [Curvivirga sp.]|uniref:glutamate--tRNA ligase n=1 Tax=Curvivirga sp. TaxID=2856848 RepID=UPI003B5AC616
MMTVKVRFAPSPTGKIHVGNVRVAIMNWLFARSQGGIFQLRIDDTDEERSTAEYEQGIRDDLTWLGLGWDETFKQSDRYDRYNEALDKLKAEGRLYACYETPDELELKRKIKLGQGKPPVYDRAALELTDEQIASYEAEGRRPHWRFKLLDEPVTWEDLGRGHTHFEAGHLSDPVLVREDGRFLYTISSVVDDGDHDVTHIIRGEDHVVNTAVQVQLFEALGFNVPGFGHYPLMMGADGKGLSKRLGSLSIEDMRKDKMSAQALVAYLARLGTSTAPTGEDDMQALIDTFDAGAYGRASPRYEPHELETINAKFLHQTAFTDIRETLAEIDSRADSEIFWAAVSGNLENLNAVSYWADVCFGEIEPVVADDDKEFLVKASDLLPDGDYDETTWKTWTGAVKDATDRKGKTLFLPLRKALTGKENGPELRDLLPIIGKERAASRLK